MKELNNSTSFTTRRKTMNDQFNGPTECVTKSMVDANTIFGNTQVFDGVNTCIAIQNNPNLNVGTGDFTHCATIKTAQTTSVIPITDKRIESSGPVQGYHLYIMEGKLGVQLADAKQNAQNSTWTNYVSGISVADGKTHHVAVTISRTQPDGGRFYVDGREVGRFNPTDRSGSLDNNQPLVIGKRSDSPSTSELFQGEIGEVKLFNRVLAPNEVAQLAGVTTPPVDAPPNPNDLNWYMQKAGLALIEEIGEERWRSGCELQAQQGAVTFNSGRTVTCTWQPDPGWVIIDHKIEVVQNLHNRGSYKTDILAEGANFVVNEQELGDKWKVAKDLAVKYGGAEVSTKLNVEYERQQQLIRSYQTNKNTFFMSATANGGAFQKSVIQIKSTILVKRIG
jgi:Concanavalin A-like lectin/glucanases superfamily